MTTISLVGLLVLLVTTLLVILFAMRQRKAKRSTCFRKINAISQLKRAVEMSVEGGSRIHVSLGNASLTKPASSSAFVSLAALHHISELSSNSDNPPIATSGDGALSVLSQDTLHRVALETRTLDLFEPNNGQLAGISPLSNVAGALQVIADPEVKTNVLIGNFGSEAGLLSTSSEDKSSLTITGSDSLLAQSVFFATVDHPLIGEELFAIPAYLHGAPYQIASLRVQDLLRGVIILTILVGATLKILGVV